METIKFEVGRRYWNKVYRYYGECTKRTNKSVWIGEYRYNINTYHDVERTNYHTADNYDDIEVQTDRTMKELFEVVNKVCGYEPCEYIYENEAEIYELCKDLRDYLEEYTKNKVKLEE